MSKQRDITIGVAAIVIHPTEPKVLVTRRKKGIGKGCVSFPGGHIEEMEFSHETAVRETREETGLDTWPITKCLHVEERFEKGQHRITLYVAVRNTSGVLANPEPDKHEDWQWKTIDELIDLCTPNDWIPLPMLVNNQQKLGL